jgi:hypothetical protein
MSAKPLRLLNYLDLILESISRIEEYTAGLEKQVFLETRFGSQEHRHSGPGEVRTNAVSRQVPAS